MNNDPNEYMIKFGLKSGNNNFTMKFDNKGINKINMANRKEFMKKIFNYIDPINKYRNKIRFEIYCKYNTIANSYFNYNFNNNYMILNKKVLIDIIYNIIENMLVRVDEIEKIKENEFTTNKICNSLKVNLESNNISVIFKNDMKNLFEMKIARIHYSDNELNSINSDTVLIKSENEIYIDLNRNILVLYINPKRLIDLIYQKDIYNTEKEIHKYFKIALLYAMIESEFNITNIKFMESILSLFKRVSSNNIDAEERYKKIEISPDLQNTKIYFNEVYSGLMSSFSAKDFPYLDRSNRLYDNIDINPVIIYKTLRLNHYEICDIISKLYDVTKNDDTKFIEFNKPNNHFIKYINDCDITESVTKTLFLNDFLLFLFFMKVLDCRLEKYINFKNQFDEYIKSCIMSYNLVCDSHIYTKAVKTLSDNLVKYIDDYIKFMEENNDFSPRNKFDTIKVFGT